MKIYRFVFLAVFLFFGSALWAANEDRARPNIVLIYGDDMGIDSVSDFNDKLGLKMPNIDRLASEGMSFMDAHTTSAVCTPSRYGLLTGRYNWRSRLKSGIVGKWERPLIEEGRLTLPSMLKSHGYQTTKPSSVIRSPAILRCAAANGKYCSVRVPVAGVSRENR